MPDLFENPMGLDGFEFVEFASPEPGVLEPVFHALGFEAVARHRSKKVTLYRQGGINFILNEEPKSHADYFAQEHGPCAAGMAFRVRDAHLAYNRALELGAQPVEIPTGPMELRLPARLNKYTRRWQRHCGRRRLARCGHVAIANSRSRACMKTYAGMERARSGIGVAGRLSNSCACLNSFNAW